MVIGCGWTVLLKRDNVVCFWINGWNVCFWYVLFWRLYTVLPCIYELKCFIERCSDVLVNQKKWVRKSEGDFMEMDFSVLYFFASRTATIGFILLAWPLTLHNTSCIKTAIQWITTHCFYVHCHLNICCETLGHCSISHICINKDKVKLSAVFQTN